MTRVSIAAAAWLCVCAATVRAQVPPTNPPSTTPRNPPSTTPPNPPSSPPTNPPPPSPTAPRTNPPTPPRGTTPSLPPAPAPQAPPSPPATNRGLNPAEQLTPDQFGPVDSAELFGNPTLLAPGTNVSLDNVVVRAKSGNLVRISKGRHFFYVAPVDPSVIDRLPVGAIVNVRGTLRRSPSAKQAKVIFAAGPRAASRLARDHIYIDAWDVSTLP